MGLIGVYSFACNMGLTLSSTAFKSLANTEIQNSAKIDHGILTWDDGRLDYATESLYAESHPYQRLAVC